MPSTLRVAGVVGNHGTKHAVRAEILGHTLCRLTVGSQHSWRKLVLVPGEVFDGEDSNACPKCVSRLDPSYEVR